MRSTSLSWSLVVAMLLVLSLTSASARNDDGRFDSSPHRGWFEGLQRPDGVSCCGLGDSHFTDDYRILQSGDAEVTVVVNGKKQTFVVPRDKVLVGKASENPVGHGILFLSATFEVVYCFVPTSQV